MPPEPSGDNDDDEDKLALGLGLGLGLGLSTIALAAWYSYRRRAATTTSDMVQPFLWKCLRQHFLLCEASLSYTFTSKLLFYPRTKKFSIDFRLTISDYNEYVFGATVGGYTFWIATRWSVFFQFDWKSIQTSKSCIVLYFNTFSVKKSTGKRAYAFHGNRIEMRYTRRFTGLNRFLVKLEKNVPECGT